MVVYVDAGTKMMALLWYYRPESLTPPRRSGVVECELFASRHCDVNPVDCIDDRAYVLSAAPYARFMALTKYKQVGFSIQSLSRGMVDFTNEGILIV